MVGNVPVSGRCLTGYLKNPTLKNDLPSVGDYTTYVEDGGYSTVKSFSSFFLPTMVNLKTLFICLSLTSFFELTYQLSANEVMKVEMKCLLSHRSAENR